MASNTKKESTSIKLLPARVNNSSLTSYLKYLNTHISVKKLDKKKRRNLIEEIIKNFDQEELLIAKQIIDKCIIQ